MKMRAAYKKAISALLTWCIALVSLAMTSLAPPALAATQQSAAPVRLIMVEQHGCSYCALWNEKIAPIYPKTTAGEIAPLERVDIADVNDINVEKLRPVGFTPSFMLVQGTTEIARIDGYPGEDFFWGLLEMYLKENDLWQDP